jgi:uncharacterized protein (DUF736 family)
MAFKQRPNSGTLFKNDKKSQPNHPDYRGDCEVNGTKLSISAWIKDGQRGKFMSLSFSPPRERQAAAAAPEAEPPTPEADVPF